MQKKRFNPISLLFLLFFTFFFFIPARQWEVDYCETKLLQTASGGRRVWKLALFFWLAISDGRFFFCLIGPRELCCHLVRTELRRRANRSSFDPFLSLFNSFLERSGFREARRTPKAAFEGCVKSSRLVLFLVGRCIFNQRTWLTELGCCLLMSCVIPLSGVWWGVRRTSRYVKGVKWT